MNNYENALSRLLEEIREESEDFDHEDLIDMQQRLMKIKATYTQ